MENNESNKRKIRKDKPIKEITPKDFADLLAHYVEVSDVTAERFIFDLKDLNKSGGNKEYIDKIIKYIQKNGIQEEARKLAYKFIDRHAPPEFKEMVRKYEESKLHKC